MNMNTTKRRFLALAAIAAVVTPFSQSMAVIYGVGEGAFGAAVRETFQGALVSSPASHDFGNGMVYNDIGGGALINYTSTYGMGLDPSINAGREGPGDGYLGTSNTPASFSFDFLGGISLFGFSGAEARVAGGSAGRNGELDIEFYDLSSVLLGSFSIDTSGIFAWEQWHGFSSDTLIGKVVFRDIGHSVFDDVSFDSNPVSRVPDSGASLAMLALGLAGIVAARRKR